MTKILEIHEIKPEFLKLDLSCFDILTFDDGLYTQYANTDHFAKFGKKMIFFISTGIICPSSNLQSSDLVHCADAHAKARQGNFENYMTWEQVKDLSKRFEVGGHTHTHPFISSLRLTKQIQSAKYEIENMLKCFKEHNIEISTFCYPYNDRIIWYKHYLPDNIEYFGEGETRVPIESLM